MSDQVTKARALLEIASDTYAEEILPALPAGKRYVAAMTANAFRIAQRRLTQPDPSGPLLAACNTESLGELAGSIRGGNVTGMSEDTLRQNLLTYLEAELAITNPRFLERRRG